MAIACPTVLSDIDPVDCLDNFGQPFRFLFQKLGPNSFFDQNTPGQEITLQAQWDIFAAANDDTKIIFPPAGDNGTITMPEANFDGEGTNAGGIRRTINYNASTISLELKSLPGETYAAIRNSLTGKTNLGFWIVGEQGWVKGSQVLDASGAPQPGIVEPFRVGDGSVYMPSPGIEGRQSIKMATLSFQVANGWDKYEEAFIPAFDLKTYNGV